MNYIQLYNDSTQIELRNAFKDLFSNSNKNKLIEARKLLTNNIYIKTFYGSCNLPLLVNDFEFLIFLKELNNPILVSYVEDYYSLTREQRDNKMKSYINFITFMLNKTNLNLVFNTFSYECLMSHLLVSTDINYLNEDSL